MKGKKALMYVGTGLAVGTIVYLVYNILKKQPKGIAQVATDVKSTVLEAPKDLKSMVLSNYPPCNFPLRKGCGGEKVKKLQTFLNKSGSYGLVVDGKFGDLTQNAVIEEQMPFDTFKSMYPNAVKGQVTEEYYNLYVANS